MLTGVRSYRADHSLLINNVNGDDKSFMTTNECNNDGYVNGESSNYDIAHN